MPWVRISLTCSRFPASAASCNEAAQTVDLYSNPSTRTITLQSFSILLPWNHRQNKMRRVALVVKNRLLRGTQLCVRTEIVAGVGVAIVAREVTRRYL